MGLVSILLVKIQREDAAQRIRKRKVETCQPIEFPIGVLGRQSKKGLEVKESPGQKRAHLLRLLKPAGLHL